jgi:hypothetical protein
MGLPMTVPGLAPRPGPALAPLWPRAWEPLGIHPVGLYLVNALLSNHYTACLKIYSYKRQ